MNNETLKSGVNLGLISILITLLVYVASPTLMVKWWFGLISIVISIFLVSYFGIKYRNETMGGYLTFGKAYIFSLVAMIVSGLISTLFTLSLYKVIDPSLPGVLADAAFEQSLGMVKSFGGDPDALGDEQLEQIREQATTPFTTTGALRGLIGVVIGSAIVGLITGAIIKKKEPENEVL